jgi:CDGSH-type Zn-finger protein/uncharacterized Fe-S cluster protein YjdI
MPEPTRDKLHEFENDAIAVTWSKARCIHAAECVRHLPDVFEPGRRPWVVPSNGTPDAIARVVTRCPTGALHYQRKDGGAPEAPAEHNLVYPSRSGPLHLRGQIEVVREDGSVVVEDLRVALCRCGASKNRPFCDNRHREAGFRDAGDFDPAGVKPGDGDAEMSSLRVVAERNGPLRLTGPFVLLSADGKRTAEGGRAALCRCGRSGNRPFCDGTHRTAGFEAE